MLGCNLCNYDYDFDTWCSQFFNCDGVAADSELHLAAEDVSSCRYPGSEKAFNVGENMLCRAKSLTATEVGYHNEPSSRLLLSCTP